MKCKDCEKYFTTATSEHGVCNMLSSWLPTEAENDCCYISNRITFNDCGRFGNDFACFIVDEDDDAKGCIGFIDMQEEDAPLFHKHKSPVIPLGITGLHFLKSHLPSYFFRLRSGVLSAFHFSKYSFPSSLS